MTRSERGDDATTDSREAGDGDDPRADDAYADWSLPRQEGEAVDGEAVSDESSAADEVPVPPDVRQPLLRDRVRDRLGLSPKQWYVVESFLLVLPYPLFVLVYLTVDVNETLFLLVTGGYSLVAMYVGFLS